MKPWTMLLTGLGICLVIWSTTLIRSARPFGEAVSAQDREALYRAARLLPARGPWLRLILWSIWGLGSALYLAQIQVLTPFAAFTVFTICLLHTLIIALIRWVVHQRLMQNVITELRLAPSWPQLQADLLSDQLVGVAVVVGALTGSFLGLFVYLFVPITIAQYVRMETWFPWIGTVASQARRDLELALAATRTSSLPPFQAIAQLPARPDTHLLYVPRRGTTDDLLDRDSVSRIRQQPRGTLHLPNHGWRGTFAQLDPLKPDKGSLAVLFRDTVRQPLSLDIMGLVFFFVIVLAIALGVVLMTSADLTRPLAALEQRAAEMSQGKLEQPMLPGGEFDEIGRLTLSFETMRQELQQKILTIEQLNIGLEGKVQQHTAALERSNSELLAALTALQKTQQQLVTSEKLASIGQLVAGIAHEINNPINAVINTIEPLDEVTRTLLEAEPQDPAQLTEAREDLAAMLRVIRSGAQRTQRIVLALRNYTRQDSEALSSFHLHQDIEETLALLQHKLREVTVEQELTAQPVILAYRGQLNQALMNLIANAADALEGQPKPRILIRTQDRADRLQIIVQDNGPGIPAELVPRIFDPFFTTEEVNKGTGLGLSITQRIMERHGGTIAVHSDEQGTRITLELSRHGHNAARQTPSALL